MGPFGTSPHDYRFFSSLPPSNSSSDGRAFDPSNASLVDLFKTLQLTYLLIKGLNTAHNASPGLHRLSEGWSDVKSISTNVSVQQGLRRGSTSKLVGHGQFATRTQGERKVRGGEIRCKNDGRAIGRGQQGGNSEDADEGSDRPQPGKAAGMVESKHSAKESAGGSTLGLAGLSLGLQHRQEIVSGIKVASAVVKGVKVAKGVYQGLRSPASDVLMGLGAAEGAVMGLKAAKIVVKGVRLSKGLVTVTKLTQDGANNGTAEQLIHGSKSQVAIQGFGKRLGGVGEDSESD